jgi:gamma-glutamyltranspeptidase/glutathione hydrolase
MSVVTAVRETAMSGIGGAGLLLAHSADSGEVTEVDFYGRTPAGLPEEVFAPHLRPREVESNAIFGWRAVLGEINERGYLAVGVPSYVAGIGTLHRSGATLAWEDLLAPAERVAREGFRFDEEDVTYLALSRPALERFDEARRLFLDGWPSYARPFKQEDLARTLRTLAADGPMAFYRGALAEQVAGHVQAHGGVLSVEDFERYEPRVSGGLRTTYGGYEVVTSSGLSGGSTLIEMLNLAEQLQVGELEHNSPRYLRQLAEVMRQAWVDRFVYLGDPDSAPIDGLTAKGYATATAPQLDGDGALPAARPGDPWAFSTRTTPDRALISTGDQAGAHTTSLAAADADGNLVTVTQTLGHGYGSCVAAPGTGMLVYDPTFWMNPEPGTPNSVGPWKQPLGSATPVVLRRDGEPVLAVSTPGARSIPTCILQLILNVVDFGMTLQDAIAAPRIHFEGTDPADPLAPAVKPLLVDARISRETVAALERLSYPASPRRGGSTFYWFGRPAGVELRGGTLLGGADIYGRSVAVGV